VTTIAVQRMGSRLFFASALFPDSAWVGASDH